MITGRTSTASARRCTSCSRASPPYDGQDGAEVALRHVHDPVPTLPKASRKLKRLFGRMMAKAPETRHADYGELLRDIDRLLRREKGAE